jgi:exopolyphosphatase/guanosine-5'-triphosphate,3'-diphosphate pyrophosphatase
MPRYAAIDIGSNSIRMLAAEVVGGSPIKTLASSRQVTRLGESVFRGGRVSQSAMDLCSNVLAQMAAEYRAVGVIGVRAVGTSALRDASNQAEFLKRASAALQSPVEVISGQERRYSTPGVQQRWPHPRSVLILDIGGGSAGLILSEHGRMAQAFSKQLGLRLKEVFSRAIHPTRLHRLYRSASTPCAARKRAHHDRHRHLPPPPPSSAVSRVPRAKRDTATACAPPRRCAASTRISPAT